LIANLPAEYAQASVSKVLFPVYGRVRGEAERTTRLVNEALTLATGFLWPIFGLLAGAAPVVVSILLGPRWDSVPPLLTLFAVGACGNIATGLLTSAAEAFGWMRTVALRQLAFASLMLVALAIVYLTGAPVIWVAASVACAEWGAFFATLQPFIRQGVVAARPMFARQSMHLALATAALAVSAACSEALGESALIAQVGAQLAVATLLALVLVAGRNRIPAMVVLRERLGGWEKLGLPRRFAPTSPASG
jgi:O-antigen/teichoic acid export membrane protein